MPFNLLSGQIKMKQHRPLCLASGSPRRKELLEQFGLQFEIYPVDVDESEVGGESPETHVARLAGLKAKMARHRFGDHVVLAGDTVVADDDKILGKPKNASHARAMLRQLSGKTHRVLTAYHLWDTSSDTQCANTTVTEVTFRPLTEAWLDYYTSLPECLDKAGGYGIQGVGGAMVKEIHGSYNTVVGFPIESILWDLVENGWVEL